MSSIGNLRALIVTAAMAALSAGCSTETTAVKTTATGDPAPAAAALASVNATEGDYQISSRDILEVAVFQVADLNKTVQVTDDGNITLPLIGPVPVKGKTTHAAADLIAQRLAKKYMQSPQVSVFVKQYGQRVTISGEVKSPRVLPLEGSMTLTQALANAGGLGDLADSKRVHIARANGGKVTDEVFDVNAIQAGTATDPVLRGGDLIVAEQSGFQVVFKNMKDMLPFAVLATIL